MARHTLKDVKASLGALGLSCRKTDYGDYRVTFKPPAGATRAQLERLEALASYNSDLEDALLTGCAMYAHRRLHPGHYADLGEAWAAAASDLEARAMLGRFAPGAGQ